MLIRLVVRDSDVDFTEVWGHTWSGCCYRDRSKDFAPGRGFGGSGGSTAARTSGSEGATNGFDGGEWERLFELTIESPDAWFSALLFVTALFTLWAATTRPYQAFSVLGFTGALFSWKHRAAATAGLRR